MSHPYLLSAVGVEALLFGIIANRVRGAFHPNRRDRKKRPGPILLPEFRPGRSEDRETPSSHP